jgi:hypothetical protein
MAKKPNGPMRLYRSYMFRNKDPAIDEFRTVMEDEYGTTKLTRKMMKEVETQGGPNAGTIHNWFHGATKRPMNASIEAAGRALGMRRVWVTDKGKNDNGKRGSN